MVVRGCNQSATRSNEPFGLTGVPTKSSGCRGFASKPMRRFTFSHGRVLKQNLPTAEVVRAYVRRRWSYGCNEARYAAAVNMSCVPRWVTTDAMSGIHAPFRLPRCMSYSCRTR